MAGYMLILQENPTLICNKSVTLIINLIICLPALQSRAASALRGHVVLVALQHGSSSSSRDSTSELPVKEPTVGGSTPAGRMISSPFSLLTVLI